MSFVAFAECIGRTAVGETKGDIDGDERPVFYALSPDGAFDVLMIAKFTVFMASVAASGSLATARCWALAFITIEAQVEAKPLSDASTPELSLGLVSEGKTELVLPAVTLRLIRSDCTKCVQSSRKFLNIDRRRTMVTDVYQEKAVAAKLDQHAPS